MERTTFIDPRVQALFDDIRPLQADVTGNDDVDQALMAKFGVIGPPAILFFDRNGKEMQSFRLVGFFKADEFTQHLEKVLAAP
jgi:thiol:disulfide interchange protein DsbD